MTEIPTTSMTVPNSLQMNGGSTSHPTRVYTGPQMNVANQFAHILDMSYVNPVPLNCVLESVIAGKLQEFKDTNRPSIPDYNKPYPSWHDEMSFPRGYHQPEFQMLDDFGESECT